VPGLTCRSWATLAANHHNHPNQRPNAGLGDHNYCRNPDGGSRAWWSRRRVPRLYRARAATDGPAAATREPRIQRRAGRTVTSRPAPPAAPRRTRGGASIEIIIPVVVAAVLLVAAVLFLVRKRRVATATPDEIPQIAAEAAVEAS